MDCNPNDPAPLPVVNRTSSTYRCPKDHRPEAFGVVSGEPPQALRGAVGASFAIRQIPE